MNTKIIHSTILLVLMALTAHEVHATFSHDVEACEVCIHVQSNDDNLHQEASSYAVFELSLDVKYVGQQASCPDQLNEKADLIRGPPQISSI